MVSFRPFQPERRGQLKKLAAALMFLGAFLLIGAPAHAYPPGAVIVDVVTGSPGPVIVTSTSPVLSDSLPCA